MAELQRGLCPATVEGRHRGMSFRGFGREQVLDPGGDLLRRGDEAQLEEKGEVGSRGGKRNDRHRGLFGWPPQGVR